MATQSVKDILDAEVPSPSYVLNPTIASGLRNDVTFSRSGSARTLDPRTSTYKSVGSGTERIYGGEQELLVETNSRTNYVAYSSQFSNWSDSNNVGADDTHTSIIEGENASRVFGDGSFTAIRVGAGSYSSAKESLYAIVEKDNLYPSDNVVLRSTDEANFNRHAAVKLDTTNGVISLKEGLDSRKQVLTREGPNGGIVWLIEVQCNPTNDGVGGTSRRIDFYPDQNGSDGVYVHHVQLEHNDSGTSPILTAGGSASRNKDSLSFSAGEWWNEREGTFFLEVRPLTFEVRNEFDNGICSLFSGAASWLRLRGGTPFTVSSKGAGISISGSIPAYEKSRVALTFSNSGRAAIAVNGDYQETTGGGETLTSKGNIEMGSFETLVASFGTIRYIPQSLPTSRSDRSAGDPISLETLTA